MPQNKRQTNVIIQERDIQTLKELLACRIMTLKQIAELLFEGRYEAARKRVQKLRRAGLIVIYGRSKERMEVLAISRLGLKQLKKNGNCSGTAKLPKAPPYFRIVHDLEITAVRVQIQLLEKEHPSFKLLGFDAYPQKLSLPHGNFTIYPDAYAEISINGQRRRFFIEIDRSTEKRAELIWRLLQYWQVRAATRFRIAAPAPNHVGSLPFQVIVICKTSARARNLFSRMSGYKWVNSFSIFTTKGTALDAIYSGMHLGVKQYCLSRQWPIGTGS